ncbi:ribonuclease HI [Candidatus Nucleicultrix amoebiphila]|jgi:ribonuclease HI|uniref:ribonuclease HI n=1 Tax=Candidatus Nucleicultrix amoebiphila TaxID=1509244 RepID=UPI000A26FA6B|nr:ribonuclease HI [Candidatus Nucleicultrix amoebiphila]
MSNSLETIEIFTDGACSGNPGPGGWGVIIRRPDGEEEYAGGEAETTNNRMELMAAIKAFEILGTSPFHLVFHTDSKYLKDGITQWLPKWKENGWKTYNNKPVKNIDLWQRLDELSAPHKVEWHWVKGHNEHPENERADVLAKNAIVTEVMKATMAKQNAS